MKAVEAAPVLGGTWYWNCYPGARTDSPSHVYQYWFSDELLTEWSWSERYTGQAETERYLNYVADRFDLRRDVVLQTRVEAAIWDEAASRWSVTTDCGRTFTAQFLICCMGPLTAPLVPPFPGHETFAGTLVHTARWPRAGDTRLTQLNPWGGDFSLPMGGDFCIPLDTEKLVPHDHGFGTRRVPLENGYFDMFNRDNVELIDLRETPIERITAAGIRTSAREIPLDVIVLATGFDAGTGGFTAIDIRGRDGVSLRDAWSREVRTTMGLQIHGYPNLFTTSAPYAPAAAFCNAPTCLQHQVMWITDCIAHLRRNGHRVMEPTAETEARWLAHHDEIADMTLLTKTRSWYMGSNVEGKPRRLISYIGGLPAYREACENVKAKRYEGFALS